MGPVARSFGEAPASPPRSKAAVSNTAGFDLIVARDTPLLKLGGGMKFIEGPVWLRQDGGYLVFSDIPSDELKRWSADSGVKTFRHPSQNANGNALDRDGRLISCEHRGRRLSILEKDGTLRTLVDRYHGRKLNSPNDVTVKSDGTVWFTDPPYGLPPDGIKEMDGNYVYCFDPKTQDLTIVAKDFDMPNGLCFSPDEKKLYIADSGKPHHVRVFEVQPDNTLRGGAVFCRIEAGVPDGIRCDSQGHVYSTAGDGIHVFEPDGSPLGRIPVPESPANLCFGGADGKTLFITASTSLYSIRVLVTARQ